MTTHLNIDDNVDNNVNFTNDLHYEFENEAADKNGEGTDTTTAVRLDSPKRLKKNIQKKMGDLKVKGEQGKIEMKNIVAALFVIVIATRFFITFFFGRGGNSNNIGVVDNGL